MPMNMDRETPAEMHKRLFEKDVEVMTHLVYREIDDIDPSTIVPEASELAEELLNGRLRLHPNPAALVLQLYELDDTKKNRLNVLLGV